MKVYRLITNRTYEMEMFQRANLKLGLDKAVLNPLKQNLLKDGRVDVQRMNKKEAETLLKYSAYDFFKEEREGRSEELSNAFCEADIDQILEKNAKVITVDSQGGSSFSKASFVTDTSAEVDINDPNFWTKVIGLQEPREETMGPRVRKKVEYKATMSDETLQETGFEDESEWVKTDRDALVKRVGVRFGRHVDAGVRLGRVGGAVRPGADAEASSGLRAVACGEYRRSDGADRVGRLGWKLGRRRRRRRAI